MENFEDNVEVQDEPVLVVTEEMRSYFYDMAKWAGFIAIVGFVFAGVSIIAAFTVGASLKQSPELAAMPTQFAAVGPAAFTILFLIMAFALFYPSLLLFKYSATAKQGILYLDQNSLTAAVSKLKSLFQFWGIITIIYVGLQVLLFIASLTSGLAGG